MASVLLFLLPILALLVAPSIADENNLLLTGETLSTDGQLSQLDSTFVMQDDCNLVLYSSNGARFQSNTRGKGINCTLTLNNFGQLIIRSADGYTVWTSTPAYNSVSGKYAAVLQSDGVVVIYGPSVWSTPEFHFTASGGPVSEFESQSISRARNALFSDQTLFGSHVLATRDYTLVMRDDCNLALVKASVGDIWSSNTKGLGSHCFAQLDHQGRLVVQDHHSGAVWGSTPPTKEGDFVLILQINGQAVVYGPAIWSTVSF